MTVVFRRPTVSEGLPIPTHSLLNAETLGDYLELAFVGQPVWRLTRAEVQDLVRELAPLLDDSSLREITEAREEQAR